MTPSVYDPTLEYVAVAETALSDVDGEAGELTVGGYPIEELADRATYEEAVYLLVNGRLPTEDELAGFRAELANRRGLSDGTRALLERAAAAGAGPMGALRMGLAAATLGADDPDSTGGTDATAAGETAAATADEADAKRAIAVVPTIVATYWRYREGNEPVDPRPDLGHAANYRYMVTGEEPDEAVVDGLETVLTTLVDHGLNASTFTARVVASTGGDLVSAATAAAGALGGPRHGRLEELAGLLERAHGTDAVERVVRDHVEREGRPPGFGHPVYRVRDPRVAVVLAAAEPLSDEGGFLDTVRTFESVGTDVLATEHDGRAVPNVEGPVVAVLRATGVPVGLFTPTFAVARVGGWMAHALEQRTREELIRPVSRYVGDTGRSWTPPEKRHVAGDAIVDHPLRADSLEPISDTLDTLSEPNRLEILLALYDGEGPLAYSQLRGATSIDDKGRFNYHLRKLREYFVTDGEEGYALTDAGRRVVRTVVTDDRFLDDS